MDQPEFVFDLKMKDSDLLSMFRQDFEEAERYTTDLLKTYNDDRSDNVRELGEKVFKGHYYVEGELYDHQVPFVDNRIFVSIDTDIPKLTAKIPEPVAKTQLMTDVGRRYANRFQTVLEDGWVRWGIADELPTSLLHLFLAKRVGVMKGRFDPDKGEHGDIVWESVLPENIVIPKTKPGKNPPFVGEWIEMTLDEIIEKFGKREEVLAHYGYKMGTEKQLTRRVSVLELHFTYRDRKNKKMDEGVAHILDWSLVLGKMKDPNWIYPEDQVNRRNHLEMPRKPYVFIGFRNLNFGRQILDDTSHLEQSLPQQDVVNKRGRQVVENADQAVSGVVYNTQAITPEEIEELTGDPNERVGVNGDVRGAATRLPAVHLESWVFQSMIDARNEVDNIFATQAPARGEPGANDTLGQDILQSQKSTERLDSMAKSLAKGAREIYNFSMQLMKVHFDAYHFARVLGPLGTLDFEKFIEDGPEDGLDIGVEPGSLLPTDKFSKRQEAIELFNSKALDPLTLYEELEVPNPKERLKRLIAFNTGRFDMLVNADIEEDDDVVTEAFGKILNGETPDAPLEVTEQSLATINRILEMPQVRKLADDRKAKLKEYAQAMMAKAQTQAPAAPPTGAPPINQPQPAAPAMPATMPAMMPQ